MRLGEGLRGEALIAAFVEALAGKDARLFQQLENLSGLPGTRMNLPLAHAFATECMHRGKTADALAFRMAELHPDIAPGGSPKEMLPACGVLAVGARASEDPKIRKRALTLLHDAAEDLRFRVREVVPLALAKMGAAMGDSLVHETASWMDGFFQATAVILAMADPQWLPAIDDAGAALDRLDEAYLLARNAPRAASRYPGRKALVDALAIAPAALATRFGVPVFDVLARWSDTEMPELRAAIETTLKNGKVAGRYKDEVERVRHALDASVPPPRDPTILRQGMRGRGKKRGRR
jgi:hypothetical protein